MEYQPGWGVGIGGNRWHRLDYTKMPHGQVSFCGVGIFTPPLLEKNPHWTSEGPLADVLTGRRPAPVCKKCAT